MFYLSKMFSGQILWDSEGSAILVLNSCHLLDFLQARIMITILHTLLVSSHNKPVAEIVLVTHSKGVN